MVSIDKVYQKVLALANKEQRGYITPQEFNLFADQAQIEIFEQYFYDLNQQRRFPGNNTKYADIDDILEEKISIFKSVTNGISDGDNIDNSFYRIISLTHGPNTVMEEVRYEDWAIIQSSPLTRSADNRPLWYRRDGKIWINSDQWTPSLEVSLQYIRKPLKPSWGYVVVSDKPLYNSATSIDFELHLSEESELVYRILLLAGITLEKPTLVQTAASIEQNKVQQEKL
mgnify:FL=1